LKLKIKGEEGDIVTVMLNQSALMRYNNLLRFSKKYQFINAKLFVGQPNILLIDERSSITADFVPTQQSASENHFRRIYPHS